MRPIFWLAPILPGDDYYAHGPPRHGKNWLRVHGFQSDHCAVVRCHPRQPQLRAPPGHGRPDCGRV